MEPHAKLKKFSFIALIIYIVIMMSRYAVTIVACALFIPLPLFATEAVTTMLEKRKDGEEKQAISFLSAMCLQTGGKTEKIEQKLGKAANQLEKTTLTGDYIVGQSEDVWTVPSAVKDDPYILSVTRNGTCYVTFNSPNSKQLRAEFKAFVSGQANAIKSKIEVVEPATKIPEELQVDFYDVKIPSTEHKIKFSLAVPKDYDNSRRSTMTVASE